MRIQKIALALTAVLATAACGRDAEPRASDMAWLDSLTLAVPAPVDTAVASPMELGLLASDAPPAAEEQPAEKAASPAPRKKSSSSRASSSRRSSSGGGSYSEPAPQRQPRVVTVKHTKRDAAIGAVAGATIGAVAGGSKHRIRNAAIGAVVGGVVGGVIGNNVDKSTRIEY